MYKVASDSRQAALHRGRPSDWVGGEEILKPADQLRQLQDTTRILHDRIKTLPFGEERSRLGCERFEAQQKIAALKKQMGKEHRIKQGLCEHIVDAAKEILSKGQFDLIYRAGHRRWEEAQKPDTID